MGRDIVDLHKGTSLYGKGNAQKPLLQDCLCIVPRHKSSRWSCAKRSPNESLLLPEDTY